MRRVSFKIYWCGSQWSNAEWMKARVTSLQYNPIVCLYLGTSAAQTMVSTLSISRLFRRSLPNLSPPVTLTGLKWKLGFLSANARMTGGFNLSSSPPQFRNGFGFLGIPATRTATNRGGNMMGRVRNRYAFHMAAPISRSNHAQL